MKLTLAALLTTLSLAACAHPLETVAERAHEARIHETNANQPINRGAADGMGTAMIQRANGATLTPVKAAKADNP